ncbi:MAG: DUF134 domain-containing protein [Ignisphaera sp.]
MPRRFRRGWMGGFGVRTPPAKCSIPIEDTIFIPVKPVGSLSFSDYIEIYDYEVEALVHIHVEGLSMEEAANRMGLSKATFWRILEGARFKIAKALAERKPMKLVSTRQIIDDNKSLLTEKQVSSTGDENGLVE